MRHTGRVAAWGAGALAALYTALGLVIPVVVDADRFRPRVESHLANALGRPVRLGRLDLSVWSGVVVRAERLRLEISAGADPDAGLLETGPVAVRLAMWPLLRGSLRVRSVGIRGGEWRTGDRVLVSAIDASARLGSAPDGAPVLRGRFRAALGALRGDPCDSRFEVTIRGERVHLDRLDLATGPARVLVSGEASGIGSGRLRVALNGTASLERSRAEGTLEWQSGSGGRSVTFRVTSSLTDFDEVVRFLGTNPASPDGPRISLGGFGQVFAASPVVRGPAPLLREIVGGGTFEAARVRFRGLEAADFATRVSLDRGLVRFEDAAFAIYGGRHRGTLTVDLSGEGSPFLLDGRIEGVDASRLLAAGLPALGGALHGTASIRLTVRGGGTEKPLSRSVSGSVRAELQRGRLASVGILKQVAELLEMAGGRGIGVDETPFDHLSASFDVRENVASTHDLEFRSADLDLDGGGSVGLEGSLHLDVLASFSSAASADLVRSTPRLGFRVNDRGRLTLPLRIRGTIEAPTVQLDLDRVLKEGLERSIRTDRKTGGLLDRLFGGR